MFCDFCFCLYIYICLYQNLIAYKYFTLSCLFPRLKYYISLTKYSMKSTFSHTQFRPLINVLYTLVFWFALETSRLSAKRTQRLVYTVRSFMLLWRSTIQLDPQKDIRLPNTSYPTLVIKTITTWISHKEWLMSLKGNEAEPRGNALSCV